MYEEEIEVLNAWIEDADRSLDTSFNGDEYVIGKSDVEDFCDFLRELDSDLIGFPVMVGTDGIWFKQEDLEKARYI